MNKAKFNLFVVGAMKAGTTSFTKVLSKHPNIYFSPIKEPNYFTNELPLELYEPSKFFSLEKYFKNDFPASLHIASLENINQYNLLTELWEGEDYLMEASTAYLHAPGVAERIHQYNENAKIIIIKRDPNDRCYSHYKMLQVLGKEERSYQEVMEEQINLYKKGQLPWYSILAMSFYKEPILKYKSIFEHVLELSFEEITFVKPEFIRKLEIFLEIEEINWETNTHKNKTRGLRFKRMFFFLKRLGIKDYFSLVFGTKFKHFVFRLITKNNTQEIQISQSTREELEKIFRKESYT